MSRTILSIAAVMLLLPLSLRADEPLKEKGTPSRLDHHGDPLPKGALARLGTVRLRTGADSRQVAFSPDGKLIASVGDGFVQFWDAATGKETRRIALKPVAGSSIVAFTADGKLAAVRGSDNGQFIQLLETATGREVLELRDNALGWGLAFARDGQVLFAGSQQGKVLRWQTNDGKPLPPLEFGKESILSVAVSPDGKLVAAGGRGNLGIILVWDATTNRVLHQIDTGPIGTRSLAFLPDNLALVATFGDDPPRMWDLPSGKFRRVFGPCGESMAVAPDGKSLAIHCGNQIRRWNLTTDHELPRLRGFAQGDSTLCYAPDSLTLAFASMGVIRLWDFAKEQERFADRGSTTPLLGLRFLDGFQELATWSEDGRVRFWDRSGKVLRSVFMKLLVDRYTSPTISPDGKFLATWKRDLPLNVSDTKTGELWSELEGPIGNLGGSMLFTPQGKLLAMRPGDSLRIWDPATGKMLSRINGNANFALTISPDGKLLAWVDNQNRVCLWEMETNEERLRLRLAGEGAPMFLAFDKDGSTLWAAFSGKGAPVMGIKTQSGVEVIRQRLPAEFQPNYFALSPDGRTMAVAGREGLSPRGISLRNALLLVEMATGQVRRRLDGDGSVNALAYAPDHVLASAHGATVLLWEGVRPVTGKPDRSELAEDAVKECWSALGGDGERAYSAVCDLVRSPRAAMAWLEKHLPPLRAVDPERGAQLLKDLASEKFPVREAANKALGDLGEGAAALLRNALRKPPDLETEQRVRMLLEDLDHLRSPKRLREVRAVEVLEHLDTPEARRLLKSLADGLPEARLTQEAQAALMRLTP